MGMSSVDVATTYPVPISTRSSIDKRTLAESKLARYSSGFATSKSAEGCKSPAVTWPGP